MELELRLPRRVRIDPVAVHACSWDATQSVIDSFADKTQRLRELGFICIAPVRSLPYFQRKFTTLTFQEVEENPWRAIEALISSRELPAPDEPGMYGPSHGF
jgi:hypothetical protein